MRQQNHAYSGYRTAHLGALIALVVITLLGSQPSSVFAWKPTTHVSLAEVALADVLDDGRVTILAVDYEHGNVITDPGGKAHIIGTYPVDPQIYAALHDYPAQFRAGSFGPDAYPDILTGQQIIHPAGGDSRGQPSGVDINYGGPGPDPWLVYLYSQAFTGCDPDGNNCRSEDVTLPNQAFVLGFLTHAAGDMYAHTLINHYTGGPFHYLPLQENAIKHVVLEGYIDERVPEPTYDASIDNGVDAFIYRNMIDARPGTYLNNHLLKGDLTFLSLPDIFSQLRAKLDSDIGRYFATLATFNRRYDQKLAAANRCKPLDFSCSAVALRAQAAAILAEKGAYVATNRLPIAYKQAWRDDIDSGLRALPTFSHELAKALFFNPEGLNIDRAKELVENYTVHHLLSMAGAPDAVGSSIALIDEVLEAIGIPEVKQVIEDMKRDLLNFILRNTFNLTVEEIEQYIENPANQFNPVMNSPALNQEGTGNLVDLRTFNSQELRINDLGNANPDEKLDFNNFPPGYNSLTMIKLLLMSSDGTRQLLRDLQFRGSLRSTRPNSMLGFALTLDGSNQWSINDKKMLFAQDCLVYRKIFMRQTGELPTPCSPIGWLDSVSREGLDSVRIRGWAIDPDTTDPATIHVYSDDIYTTSFSADQPRPDLRTSYPGYGDRHGFDIVVPLTGKTICLYGINIGVDAFNSPLGCRDIPVEPFGSLDAAKWVAGAIFPDFRTFLEVQGWAIDPDTDKSIDVHVYINDSFAAAGVADQPRPDVAAAFPGYKEIHGFNIGIQLPPKQITTPFVTVCVYGINKKVGTVNSLIGCKKIGTR